MPVVVSVSTTKPTPTNPDQATLQNTPKTNPHKSKFSLKNLLSVFEVPVPIKDGLLSYLLPKDTIESVIDEIAKKPITFDEIKAAAKNGVCLMGGTVSLGICLAIGAWDFHQAMKEYEKKPSAWNLLRVATQGLSLYVKLNAFNSVLIEESGEIGINSTEDPASKKPGALLPLDEDTPASSAGVQIIDATLLTEDERRLLLDSQIAQEIFDDLHLESQPGFSGAHGDWAPPAEEFADDVRETTQHIHDMIGLPLDPKPSPLPLDVILEGKIFALEAQISLFDNPDEARRILSLLKDKPGAVLELFRKHYGFVNTGSGISN